MRCEEVLRPQIATKQTHSSRIATIDPNSQNEQQNHQQARAQPSI